MSYQALARKWRPRQFQEVLGQQHVVSALINALDNQRVHHAYLFTGTRGVGKTTLARIFARALNCETGVSSTPCGECMACKGVDHGNYIDLLEVDAASRTRVDDTRELLDNVQYAPTQGRFKIYLIDEVHMLSTHSFNALLKTLEEPPPHVKFLLATTDPQKLPATILSRCIQFNLKAMDVEQLDGQLEKILAAEDIESEPEARRILARAADGSVRDALSLLDQAVAFGNGQVGTGQVRSMLGMIDDRFVFQILDQIVAGDGAGLLETVAQMAERTVDYAAALNDLLSALHYAALHQVDAGAVGSRGVDQAPVARLAEQVDPERLQLLYQIALVAKRDFSLGPDPRSSFEMSVLRMNAFQPQTGSNMPVPGPARPEPVAAKQSSAPPSAAASEPRRHAGTAPAAVRPEPPASGITDSSGTPKAVADDTGTGQGDIGTLASNQGWATFVEQSGLVGMPRELAMNMSPGQLEEGVLGVLLEQSSRHLFNDKRQKRIEEALSEHFGQTLTLKVDLIDLEEGTEQTPAQIKQKAADERQKSAEQSFSGDHNVQTLVDLFDAEVVPDSVRPSS